MVLQRRVTDVSVLVGRPVTALEAAQGTTGLSGSWRKDRENSDSMDAPCELIRLPWIYRKALLVLNNMEVEDTEEYIKTTLKAGGLMDVVECYPWSGEIVKHKRRDKRKGHHLGRVVRTEKGPCIEVTWENPYGGDGTDTFVLSEDGLTLTQITDMTIRDTGERCHYRTVYRRRR
ncbi:hypothetical protein COCOBI_09-3500 [Coccomyxa sp. Obi]|nr:hypothetical protein COCOBI_09-3500 [Coccomyxa sp. Obi]